MINKIITNLIDSIGEPKVIDVENINIFVGPNSSGKSLMLNELNGFLTLSSYDFSNNSNFKIIKAIDFEPVSIENQIQFFNSFQNNLSIDTYNVSDPTILKFDKSSILASSLYRIFNLSSTDRNRTEYYDKYRTLFLNGSTRLSLLNSEHLSLYDRESSSVYAKIYHNPDLYNEFRGYVKDAFNLYTYFKIDGSRIEFVFSRIPAPNDFDEFSLRNESIDFLKTCLTNADLSDGQKSYIGILLQLLAGDPETIIIDEVEAFLHPPLARKLGSLVSKLANEMNKQVFLATHSPNIIMGAIQSGANTNIIRLTYDGESGQSTIINSKKLKEIMSHPLIRSTNFLDALFYKNAIVTESDSDRAFYQEINYRLTKFKPEYGIEDCIFLNAQNKQTVGTIVKELRHLGVPTVSIIDLDFLVDGGNVFTGYLNSVNIPESLHSTIETTKSTLKSFYSQFSDEYKTLKKYGVTKLDQNLLIAANHLLETLSKYGQFVVPVGELECWLPEVSSYNHGSKWLIKKFESLGFDETSPNYVKPADDDVWKFMQVIKLWLENSDRLGMLPT